MLPLKEAILPHRVVCRATRAGVRDVTTEKKSVIWIKHGVVVARPRPPSPVDPHPEKDRPERDHRGTRNRGAFVIGKASNGEEAEEASSTYCVKPLKTRATMVAGNVMRRVKRNGGRSLAVLDGR